MPRNRDAAPAHPGLNPPASPAGAGRLEWIGVRPSSRVPMRAHESVQARSGHGLGGRPLRAQGSPRGDAGAGRAPAAGVAAVGPRGRGSRIAPQPHGVRHRSRRARHAAASASATCGSKAPGRVTRARAGSRARSRRLQRDARPWRPVRAHHRRRCAARRGCRRRVDGGARMTGHVIISHGLESSPDASKATALSRVADALGWTQERPDYRRPRRQTLTSPASMHGRIAHPAGSGDGRAPARSCSPAPAWVRSCPAGLPAGAGGRPVPDGAADAARRLRHRALEAARVPTRIVHGWDDELIPAGRSWRWASAASDTHHPRQRRSTAWRRTWSSARQQFDRCSGPGVKFFVACAKGLEYLLVDEARRWAPTGHRDHWPASMSTATRPWSTRLAMFSRLASRVLWPLADFACRTSSDLYQGVHAIDWHAAPRPGAHAGGRCAWVQHRTDHHERVHRAESQGRDRRPRARRHRYATRRRPAQSPTCASMSRCARAAPSSRSTSAAVRCIDAAGASGRATHR